MNDIETIRKQVLGISQEEMSKGVDVKQATISRWETGEHSPRARDIVKIRKMVSAAGHPWNPDWFTMEG